MTKLEKLQKIFDKNEWIRIIKESIQETLSEVEDLQIEQFSRGLNSQGRQIGQLRSEEYARYKKNRGGKAPFGVVDLKDEGDFYSKIIAKLENKFISITSTDSKTQDLEDKYNKNGDIFPLSEKYIQKYIDKLIPYIQDNIQRWVQLNLS